MNVGVAKILILGILVSILVGCTGPVIRLPTPTVSVSDHLSPPVSGATSSPALLEHRLVILEWPMKVREKDGSIIQLTITMDAQGNLTATAQSSGGTIEPIPVDVPNLYDTHNIVAVARLDMAGVEAYREAMREPLRPGRDVNFQWSIRPVEAGLYQGVVWLHLEMVSKQDGSVENQLIMARPIAVQAVTVFGMPGWLARSLGGLGVVISTLLGLPFIQRQIDDWRRRRKKIPPAPPSDEFPGQNPRK